MPGIRSLCLALLATLAAAQDSPVVTLPHGGKIEGTSVISQQIHIDLFTGKRVASKIFYHSFLFAVTNAGTVLPKPLVDLPLIHRLTALHNLPLNLVFKVSDTLKHRLVR